MGAGASTKVVIEDRTTTQVVDELMVVYDFYVPSAVIDPVDISVVLSSWSLISNNTSQEYLKRKANKSIEENSALDWFFFIFKKIACDFEYSTDNDCSYLGRIQVKSIVTMVSSVSVMFLEKDVITIGDILKDLAWKHYQFGVRGFQYPIVCEIFMIALHYCLGDSWDRCTAEAWGKLFSVIMDYIVPAAVDMEIKSSKTVSISTKEIGSKKMSSRGNLGLWASDLSSSMQPNYL